MDQSENSNDCVSINAPNARLKSRSNQRPANKRAGERGNVFFTLFGAVAVVGVLGAGIMSTMRGPLSTMVDVNRLEQAKAEARLNSNLILAQSDDDALEVTCEGGTADGYTEGVQPLTSGSAPTGGGLLPSMGGSQTDPWGNAYGYCAWDHGPSVTPSDFSGCDNVLAGNSSNLNIAIAVISAGPDGIFQTSCLADNGGTNDYIEPDGGGGDDIVEAMTYNQAIASSGGLWTPVSTDEATISRDLTVTGGASFSGNLDLRSIDSSIFIPTDAALDAADCNSANDGIVRIDTSGSTYADYTLEICQSSTGWVPASAAGVWENGSDDDIYYNTGTPQVGIGTASPNDTLDVDGTFEATGAAALGSTLSVTGTSTLAGLDAQATTTTTLAASGNTTVGGTLGVTGATDLDSTLNVDGNTTLVGTTDAQGNVANSTGDLTLDDAVVITGTTDAQGNVANSTGDLTLDDAVVITGTTDAQGAISNSTGNVSIDDTLDVTTDLNVTGNADIDGTLEADDITWNGDDFTPPTCSADYYITWDGDSWECEPDVGAEAGDVATTLDNLADTDISSPAADQCLVYDGSEWENQDCNAASATVWEDAGTVIRVLDAASYATDDFVFGSPQLTDDGVESHDNRFYFNKEEGAFRAGTVQNNQWNNPGASSAAFGFNSVASGDYSFAAGRNTSSTGSRATTFGQNSSASGYASFAAGYNLDSGGFGSIAMGTDVTADDNYSIALGRDAEATGEHSMVIGLGNAGATAPKVSADESLAIFMGDQSSYNLSDSHIMALVGGTFLIDDDGTDTAGTNGCIRYNAVDAVLEYSDNCTDWNSFSNDISGLWTDLGGGRIHYGTSDANQVGVGTDNPQVTLDVGGTLRVGSVTGSAPNFMALNDLSDATITTPVDGQCMTYDGGAGVWINVDCQGIGGKWFDGATAGEIYYDGGNVGIGTIDPSVSLTIVGTDAVLLPAGTAAQQPSSPLEGMIRYNTEDDTFEGYVDDGTPAWEPINTGVGGKWIDGATPGEIYYDGGNVGIGTVTDPAVALDIGGTLRIADGGESCTLGTAGALRYNTNNIQYCDGTQWRLMAAQAGNINLEFTPTIIADMDVSGTCGSASCSGISYTLTLSNTGTLTSNIIAYTLQGDTANFTVTGDTCTGTTLIPNTSCTIDITPTATGNGTYHGRIELSNDNAPVSILQGEGRNFGCAPGVSGGGGTYVSCGTYNTVVMNVDAGQFTWGQMDINLGSSVQSTLNGPQNTVNLVQYSTVGGGGLYPAAEACDNLSHNGFTNWYLPASDELFLLSNTDVTASAGIAPNGTEDYWSSRENNAARAYFLANGTTLNSTGSKTASYFVRCFRRETESLPAPQIDTTPDSFNFTDISTSLATRQSSNSVTISGLTTSVSVSIAGAGTPEFSINGATPTTSGSVENGDTLVLYMDPPASVGSNSTTVTVGTVSDTWVIQQFNGGGTCNSVASFDIAGTYSYAVPSSYDTITIKMWGAGGGGGGANGVGGQIADNGDDSIIALLGLSAGGGQGGRGNGSGTPGTGGIASGGDTNTDGADGSGRFGGDAPGAGGGNGGTTTSPLTGDSPGGGGAGALNSSGAGGGGSGAYVEKTYTPSTLTPGASISNIIVGAAGDGGVSNSSGGDGGSGRVVITCTEGATPPSGATFTASLDDTPLDYTGAGAYSVVRVNAAEDGIEFAGNEALLLPAGTLAQQPLTPAEGMIRYNTDSDIFEGYVDDGTPAWEPINTGVGGKWVDGATSGEIYYDGGNIGVGTITDPAVALDIGGTLRVADGGEACDGTIPGAIRYNAGALEYCDGISWRNIAAGTGGVSLAFDKIVEIDMDIDGATCGVAPCFTATSIFTLTNTGSVTSDALTVFTFSGTTANYEITSNTCTGVALAPASSCTINIRAMASGDAVYNARVEVAHHNNPLFDVSGRATNFSCAPGLSGWGGVVVQCNYAGAGNHLIIDDGDCDGTTNEPTCSGGTAAPTKQWANTPFDDLEIGSTIASSLDGDQNHANLLGYANGNPLHFPAAQYCENLIHNSETDWFLPAPDELITADSAASAIDNSTHFTSQEARFDRACIVTNGSASCSSSLGSKSSTRAVRCMRIEGVNLPAAQTDTTPTAFTFATKFETSAGVTTTSDNESVTGITPGVTVSITGAGGEYSINGGAFTSATGTIDPNDTIAVRIDSPGIGNSERTDLTIGTLTASYTVITEGDCGGSCAGVDKRIFTSAATGISPSTTISVRDANCQSYADAAALGGTWISMASGNAYTDWAVNRIDYNWDRLINMNGDVIATSPADLWDGSISNPIDYDENGDQLPINTIIQTNTATDGSYISNSYGRTQYTDNQWIALGISGTSGSLHCIETGLAEISLSASPTTGTSMNVVGPGSPATGTEVVFTITNTGTGSTGALATSLSNSSNFAITTDTCDTQSIAIGATCSVGITPQALADGNYFSTLTILDATNSINVGVGLSGVASGFGIAVANWLNGVDAGDIYYSGGNVGINTTDPDVGLDINTTDALIVPRGTTAEQPTGVNGMVRYNSETGKFEGYQSGSWQDVITSGGGSSTFEATGTPGSEVVRNVDSTAPYTTADFVFGSPQLNDDTDANHDNRMFFDKSQAAFRAGRATLTGWDSASLGSHSAAFGINTVASGNYSFAMGNASTASATGSTAMGRDTTASAFYSTAMGWDTTASGTSSVSMGQKAIASGENTFSFGLGAAAGTAPTVSGASSFGIFMGDQSGVDVSTANVMAIMGGNVGIGNAAPDVALDVTGDIEYTGTITDVSDRRLKTNITPLSNNGSILKRIDQIGTYSFVMKDDADKRTEFGVMAQELETVFPELVHTAKDELGTKSVNYVGLIAPLIEATKELKAENDELKAELSAMKTAQAETNATLASITEQVSLLNKVAAANTVDKASMNHALLLLLGLVLGAGFVLVMTRKNHKA